MEYTDYKLYLRRRTELKMKQNCRNMKSEHKFGHHELRQYFFMGFTMPVWITYITHETSQIQTATLQPPTDKKRKMNFQMLNSISFFFFYLR